MISSNFVAFSKYMNFTNIYFDRNSAKKNRWVQMFFKLNDLDLMHNYQNFRQAKAGLNQSCKCKSNIKKANPDNSKVPNNLAAVLLIFQNFSYQHALFGTTKQYIKTFKHLLIFNAFVPPTLLFGLHGYLKTLEHS